MSQFGHRQKAVNQASSAMQTFYCRAKNTRGLQVGGGGYRDNGANRDSSRHIDL